MADIVLLANWLDDLGGVQTATRSLARALAGAGHRVRLVSVFPPVSARTRRVPALFRSGSPLRRAPGRWAVVGNDTKYGRIDRAARAAAVRRLRRLAADADAVIAMDVFAAELVAAARPAGRTLFQYHNTFTTIDGTRDLERVRSVAPSLHAVVALTEGDAQGFRDAGLPAVAAIGNVCAADSVQEVARELLVVGIGRYTTVKDFGLLLTAWAGLPDRVRVGWRLELHGEGPERAALEAAAVAGCRVFGPTDDVPALLARASVLALPSRFEGQPMVLLEAMRAGVACVATASSPGVQDLLGGEAGWLGAVGDASALGALLGEAMSHPAERERRARIASGRMDAFAPATVASRWQHLLQGAPSAVRPVPVS